MGNTSSESVGVCNVCNRALLSYQSSDIKAVNALIDDSPKYFSNYMKPYIVPLTCAALGINYFMKYWPRHTQLKSCLTLLSKGKMVCYEKFVTGKESAV